MYLISFLACRPLLYRIVHNFVVCQSTINYLVGTLSCTACYRQINPNNPDDLKQHPVLKVLICKVSMNSINCVVGLFNIFLKCSNGHIVMIVQDVVEWLLIVYYYFTTVIISQRCYGWYTSDDIDQDSNGLDEQCRWCGEGGQLVCCDYCHNAFCKVCIKHNLGRAELSTVIDAGEM